MDDSAIKILVVDDTKDSNELLVKFFTQHGYYVESAFNGNDAIHIIKTLEKHFDFIIMDQVLLGGIDGIETTRKIHSFSPDVRIIVLTIYGDEESSQAALDAGAYRYIIRPLDINDATYELITLIESSNALNQLEKNISNSFWFNKLFMDMDMAVGIIDRTYRVLYSNKAQNKIAGKQTHPGGVCWMEWHQLVRQKEPCSWCPTKPLFDGEKSVIRTIPIFNNGKWRYLQTGASPIYDNGQIIAALKWAVDVTEREEANLATLLARDSEERVRASLIQVQLLGYSRAQLYELEEDGISLVGRFQVGGMKKDIKKIHYDINADPYSKAVLSSTTPILQKKTKYGETLLDSDLDREDLEEWLDVPLRTRDGQIVGKLSIDNKITTPIRPDIPPNYQHITNEYFEGVSAIAQFAANAIWDTRRQEEVVEEIKWRRQLRLVDTEIGQELKLKPLLSSILERAVELLGANSGILFLCDRERKQLSAEVIYNLKELKDINLDYGEGLAGKVAITADPHIINDYFNSPERSLQLNKESYQSLFHAIIGVPIKLNDEVIGVLNIFDNKKDRRFNERNKVVLTDFASWAAIAIQNASLFEKEKKKAQEKATLFEVSKALSSLQNIDQLYDKIFPLIKSLIPFNNALIFKLDPETNHLVVSKSYGYRDRFIKKQGFEFKFGEGYTGRIAETRKPILIKNVTRSHYKIKPKYLFINNNIPLISFLGVPLIARGGLIGVLELTSDKPNSFNMEHQKLLILFANQLSLAIEQSRLINEAISRANRLTGLFKISDKIASGFDLETVLNLIVEYAYQIVGADSATLFYYNNDELKFEQGLRKGKIGFKPILPRIEGLWGRVLKNQLAVFIEDVGSSEEFNTRFVIQTRIKSYAAIPLVFQDHTVGLLFINYLTPQKFSSEEKETLSLLANQAAIAIENAKERNKLRSRLIKAEKTTLEARFATDYIHRINNRIGTIPLRVSKIKEVLHTDQKTLKKIRPILDGIDNDAKQEVFIITELKNMATGIPVKEEVNLIEILKRLNRRIRLETPALVKLIEKYPISEFYIINTSMWEISEAFWNILKNGEEEIIKLKDGGTLDIQVEKVKTLNNNDVIIKIEIHNTGGKIPEEILPRVFEPFFSTKENGIGYGLWRTYNFINNELNGTITMENDSDGVTTIVHLPAIVRQVVEVSP